MRIGAPLLRWFRKHARSLPWRSSRDPYRIWISEIMLQQTQIATVLPYYERWMSRFPSVKKLAAGSVDDVLKSWEGLGYYARARNLHKTAAILARDGFPTTRDGWEALPGIGPYTAAAIASIANGERVAVRDGNVHRVLARFLLIQAPVKSGPAIARMDAFLEGEIPASAPGDFNQAIMEIGQRICTPRNPSCGECPLEKGCEARKRGMQAELPMRVAKAKVPHYEIAIGVCMKRGKILVARRPEKGLLGGLWEFPGGKRRPRETFEAAVVREFREEVGIDVEVGDHLVTVPHKYSHFSVNLHTYLCRHRKGRPRAIQNDGVRWVAPAELSKLAFPAANVRIIRRLLESV